MNCFGHPFLFIFRLLSWRYVHSLSISNVHQTGIIELQMAFQQGTEQVFANYKFRSQVLYGGDTVQFLRRRITPNYLLLGKAR
jgi:hypothetical protein